MKPHKKRFKKFLSGFIFGLLLLLLNMPSNAQTFQFNSNRNRAVINFKFIKNLIIIPLTINGKGPFNFVLDTGVSLLLITDPELFRLLQIQNFRDIKIMGFGAGDDLSAYVTPSIHVTINSIIEGDMPAAILKNDFFNLSAYSGMPVHGLLGYEFFSSFIVKINYSSTTATLYKNETAYIPRKGSKLPISIEERKPYIVADIITNNNKSIPAKLIIDTGAGHPISLDGNAGTPFEMPPVNIKANLGIGLSGPINGYISRLSAVKIGKFELRNVIAAFPDYKDVAAKVFSVSRDGSIGNSIFKRFNVVFDYYHNSLYLRPSFTFKAPFEHDMSGLELEATGDNYNRIFINRVETGSAADEAELKKGDEILGINFKPASELGMYEIENMFRSTDGKTFLLDIIPANTNKRARVILVLKRRI